MKQKQKYNIFHVISNVNLMVKNVIQIKNGALISVDMRAKN